MCAREQERVTGFLLHREGQASGLTFASLSTRASIEKLDLVRSPQRRRTYRFGARALAGQERSPGRSVIYSDPPIV
jgi:hypothetical protein